MLYLATVWLMLAGGCAAVGLALLNMLKASSFAQREERLIAAIWLGLLLFANLLLGLSVALPLSPVVGAIVFFGLGGIALCQPATRIELRQWQPNRLWIVAISSLVTAIAAITSRQVTWLDTGLYHYSVIQWLSQYGSVPGVALLFANFGFTSAWFAFSAPFDGGLFTARVSAVGNGFVLLLAVVHLLLAARLICQRQGHLSDWFAVAFLSLMVPLILASSLLSDILVSPSPDLAALLLTGIVAWSILVATRDRNLQSGGVPLLLAAGAVTFKLIALPLLVVTACFWLVQSWQNKRMLLLGSAGAIGLLVPMLASSVITSGCPLYPSTLICLDLPWSPTTLMRSRVAAGTHQWTSWYGTSAAGVQGFFWALWQWFRSSKINHVIALLIGVSAVATVYLLKTMRLDGLSGALRDRQQGQLWVSTIGVTGIGFLLLTSPLVRFMLAYVLLLPALLIALWGQRWGEKVLPRRWPRATVWLCPLLATIITVTAVRNQTSRLLLPPPIQQVAVMQKQLNDFRYLSPTTDLCWATPVPCAFTVTPDVKLRDPKQGIRAGFVRQ